MVRVTELGGQPAGTAGASMEAVMGEILLTSTRPRASTAARAARAYTILFVDAVGGGAPLQMRNVG